MKLALIFGTRPEIIKIAPLILEAQRLDGIEAITINTAQHSGVVTEVLEWFASPRRDSGTPHSLFSDDGVNGSGDNSFHTNHTIRRIKRPLRPSLHTAR